jgi:tRNA pseudouridine32 synthase/23S rRNA pseudouridine746 synthase
MVAGDLSALASEMAHDFARPGDGKMLGVLIVQDADSRVGFLRAVSGMLGGQWTVPGFVPPAFDLEARESFWPEGQEELAKIEAQLEDHSNGEGAREREKEAEAMAADHTQRAASLSARHEVQRKRRAAARDELQAEPSESKRNAAMSALAEESRADRREGKQLRKALKLELEPMSAREKEAEAVRLSLKRKRTEVSNALLARIQDGYQLRNAAGESTSLRSIFAPLEPPGGSGDCAAPKLLSYAHRAGLRPIALAEFWWGASPVGGGRHAEHFYPPCKSKCGPLLPFLLAGVDHDEAPLFATESVSPDAPACLFEDDAIVVVNKPPGMLSVPGAHARLQDSVLTRLKARYPSAEGPLLVHRLDLDTSGLLVMAKSLDVYRLMQEHFARRRVQKRYLAWLDGKVDKSQGEIRLALRVDLEDRPRQIYDPKHGKEALTQYKVLERRKTPHGEFTKVELSPATGRTHQLRVHAAHEQGLNAPIVGDRLYGKGRGRLLLHAERLRFPHPLSSREVDFHSPLPEALAAPDFASIHLKL